MTTPTHDDGGPAFPAPSIPSTTDARNEQRDGMTLRDWFAGQALQGIMQAVTVTHLQGLGQTPSDEIIAKWSLSQADAMIAARKGARP